MEDDEAPVGELIAAPGMWSLRDMYDKEEVMDLKETSSKSRGGGKMPFWVEIGMEFRRWRLDDNEMSEGSMVLGESQKGKRLERVQENSH